VLHGLTRRFYHENSMVFDECCNIKDGMVSALVPYRWMLLSRLGRCFDEFATPNASSGGVMGDGGNVMAIDYPQAADFLRDELHQFLPIVRQTENEDTRRAAAERLWAAVNRVEAFSYAPGEDQWNALSESQRWGYLRLESYMGTALHELRQLQRTVWRVQDNRLTIGGTRDEARYA
jgi:hypothetical protein